MLPNKYAGITSLLEGLACQRPIVASRTVGLSDYLSPPDGITPVEPRNPAEMRAAIVSLIDHPDQARTQARQGYESVARRYNFERHLETLASRLEAL
jgi:glycosyltransferase involved in cell wall biosynthesis